MPRMTKEQSVKRRRSNTSGYPGVSWSKATAKWQARIRVAGRYLHLGLFETAEAGYRAYLGAVEQYRSRAPTFDEARSVLLDTVRSLYAENGIKALVAQFLEAQPGALYPRLLKAGLNQAALLEELKLSHEFAQFRVSSQKWSWVTVVETARNLKETHGALPTVEWCRLNGLSGLTNFVFKSGRTWEDLREEVESFTTSNFVTSRNGMRWRSRPEASLSNFLHARRIVHKRGERYPDGYSEQSGRHHGRYDLHFLSLSGAWVDVEVWGDSLNGLSGGRYRATRAFKERWEAGSDNFLGIEYRDCLKDARLAEILEPFIGVIAPSEFEQPYDSAIETAHWSNADDLLVSCRQLAAQMPDGVFPSESWLRKRGKYVDREGEALNTMAVRINQWFHGTRNLRQALNQSEASTVKWTPERAVEAWREFERIHGVSPSQCNAGKRRLSLPPEVAADAGKIYQAARLLGVLDEARQGKDARIKWTPERVTNAWHNFVRDHARTPSECMSAAARKRLPKDLADEATRIYAAARKLGLLAALRSS